MKMYLVKQTSVATSENPNFKDEYSITYYGKAEERIAREGNHMPYNNFNCIYLAPEYGYKSEAMAKRSWIYRNPENSKYWTSTVEIVEVEC